MSSRTNGIAGVNDRGSTFRPRDKRPRRNPAAIVLSLHMKLQMKCERSLADRPNASIRPACVSDQSARRSQRAKETPQGRIARFSSKRRGRFMSSVSDAPIWWCCGRAGSCVCSRALHANSFAARLALTRRGVPLRLGRRGSKKRRQNGPE